MGQEQFFHPALKGQLYRLFVGGMPPAPWWAGTLLRQVLGVVNQRVGALDKLHEIGETVAPVQAKFVVGDEHHDLVATREPDCAALGVALPVVQCPDFNGGVSRAARRVGSQRGPAHQIRHHHPDAWLWRANCYISGMSKFFRPNLDRQGRGWRGVMGALCLIVGIIAATIRYGDWFWWCPACSPFLRRPPSGASSAPAASKQNSIFRFECSELRLRMPGEILPTLRYLRDGK